MGHMTPDKDIRILFGSDSDAMQQSYYATNVFPQYLSLNRGSWNAMEQTVRAFFIEKENDDFFVITGVCFQEREDQRTEQVEAIKKITGATIPSKVWKIVCTS